MSAPYDIIVIPAWASGSERNNSVFHMLGVTGSGPQFRKPENFWKGRLDVSGPRAVVNSHAAG